MKIIFHALTCVIFSCHSHINVTLIILNYVTQLTKYLTDNKVFPEDNTLGPVVQSSISAKPGLTLKKTYTANVTPCFLDNFTIVTLTRL